MSRLEELIQEYCPDGVTYYKLGDVASVERGKRVVKDQLSQEKGYPVYQNSLAIMGFHTESNYPANTTFVIGAGAAGEIGYSEVDFWAADDCFPIVGKGKLVNRYIYHVIKWKKPYLLSKVRKASIPRLSRDYLVNMVIPVPPLPVQEEIVRILDSFTQLTAELQEKLDAELQARKKQYEYYRDSLLSYTTDAPEKRLGDTCIMKSGKAIKSFLLSNVQDNEHRFPCFGGNGIRGYIAMPSHHGEYPIIGRQGALCGNVNYATGDFYATEHAVVVQTNGEYDNRYLFHLLTSMKLNQYKSQGAQPGLAVGNIENLLAPVPPLDEQKRIVAILDRFDALCNDLSTGLPAEIQARQKQYEYYRDKLLTFPPLS